MGGDREGAGDRGPRPPPGKLQVVMYFLEEKLVRTFIFVCASVRTCDDPLESFNMFKLLPLNTVS